jgi:hypothetical protein
MANQKKLKTKRKGRPRREHEKKPSRKGVKSMRGQPEIYNELKKITSFSITPTARLGLKQLSEQLNISCSELIERIGRGLLTINENELKTEVDEKSEPMELEGLSY